MTAAIYFHPEAYSVRSDRVMGRHSAGDSFLRAIYQHTTAEELWACISQPLHGAEWSRAAEDAGWKGRAGSFDQEQLGTLRRIGALFVPGPGLGEHARKRSLWSHDAWSLCGITHTLSSARAMDSITELVSAPIMPWDALICTSRVAQSVVAALLAREEEDLAQRLGATSFTRPKLPLIPLGVHAEEFTPSEETRVLGRKKLDLADDELAVLFMGRLSFHAKAHPLPMYLALERAAKATRRKIALVECGWHGNEPIANAFEAAFATVCPSVRRISLHANEAKDRHQIWSAADVFCSLSDNIQETFGLTPIEAMAAGLPVVVSDWDGYKDTVRHGVDGFRVPTIMPRAGLGGDLALRHALEVDTYDMYIGHACSLTAVDVDATTAAFTALFESEDLRRKMGAAGQARAREVYDWSCIIPQYEDLWAQLNVERKRAAAGEATKASWPARPDPFAAFDSYPTHILTETTQLEAASPDADSLCAQVEAMRGQAMVNFAKLVLPTPEEVRLVLTRAVEGPAHAVDLVGDIAAERRAHVFRGLGWLLKIGALKIDAKAKSASAHIMCGSECGPIHNSKLRQYKMNLLFIHQNFPGQFKHLAPALVQRGHKVVALTMQKVKETRWLGVELVPYGVTQGSTPGTHPWVVDFETKIIRAEGAFRACLALKEQGFEPDAIIAHPGWGESLFLKEVWPQAKLGIFCEFFYLAEGADTGFDPEFPVEDVAGNNCRLRLKNLNNYMHFDVADAAIAPTAWQASTFPEPFRSKITVVHDGIDTSAIQPNPQVQLKLRRNGSDAPLVLTRDDEVITFVNRNLEPMRGCHIFMRALPHLLKQRPNAQVIIVGGDGVSYGTKPTVEQNGAASWKEVFVNEVRGQISDADWARVHFVGQVPYANFVSLLQLSTVHVYWTYPFVLSWSLIEAMSAGAAIVASDTAPLRKVIQHGENGLLVDFFSVGGLVQSVSRLLDDGSERDRLGSAARKTAKAGYDLKTICLPKQLAWVEALADHHQNSIGKPDGESPKS